MFWHFSICNPVPVEPVVCTVPASRTSPVKAHGQCENHFLDDEFDEYHIPSDDQGGKRKREDDFMDELIYIIDPRQADLGEIAFKSGFNDSNYFSREFRKLTGSTPSKCRADRQRKVNSIA